MSRPTEMFDRNGNSRCWVECPRCHGDWHRDLEPETGRPYSCYRCGNTGWVDAPHGSCPGCGETLLAGEGEAFEGTCEDCHTEARERVKGMTVLGPEPLMVGQHER